MKLKMPILSVMLAFNSFVYGQNVAVSIYNETFDGCAGSANEIASNSNSGFKYVLDSEKSIMNDKYNSYSQSLSFSSLGTYSNSSKQAKDYNLQVSGLDFTNGFIKFRAFTKYSSSILLIRKNPSEVNSSVGNVFKEYVYNDLKYDTYDHTLYVKDSTVTLGFAVYGASIIFEHISIFTINSTTEQRKVAEKFILSGTFSVNDVNKLNNSLRENSVVTNIDAKDAKFPEGTKLKPKNPNCLIEASSSSGIANDSNLIISGICENLILSDDGNFNSDIDFTAKNVSYDRKFNIGKTSTICLPFTITKDLVPGIEKIAIFNSFGFEKDNCVHFVTSDSIGIGIDANVPLLVIANESQPFKSLNDVNVKVMNSRFHSLEKNTAYYVGLYRTHTNIISNDTDYVYGFSGGEFVKVGSGCVFAPFRACFRVLTKNIKNPSASQAFSVVISEPNSISSVEKNEMNVDVYDMRGTCLKSNVSKASAKMNLKKGIYIIDNKKELVK